MTTPKKTSEVSVVIPQFTSPHFVVANAMVLEDTADEQLVPRNSCGMSNFCGTDLNEIRAFRAMCAHYRACGFKYLGQVSLRTRTADNTHFEWAYCFVKEAAE